MKKKTKRTEFAIFGAGCFWHVEETFRHLPGVVNTAVGFMGGTVAQPSYERVCRGNTGHAEIVQITYDQKKISYDKLLEVFWKEHDPTSMNRQGSDVGEQYRSVIFYHTSAQRAAAERSKQRLEKSGRFTKPIVTQIIPASEFYRAEEYHQKYLEKNGGAMCEM